MGCGHGPTAAAICGSVPPPPPARQRPRAQHVPICHLPGSRIPEQRLRVKIWVQADPSAHREWGDAGCRPHSVPMFLLEQLCRGLAGETEAGMGGGLSWVRAWQRAGINHQELTAKMKGLGTSQVWESLCMGVPTLPSSSPAAWQVMPGTRGCLRPALPRGGIGC